MTPAEIAETLREVADFLDSIEWTGHGTEMDAANHSERMNALAAQLEAWVHDVDR